MERIDSNRKKRLARIQGKWDNAFLNDEWKRGKFPVPRVVGILKRYNDQLGDEVLDIGSGDGRHAQLLAQEGRRITCADLSEIGTQKTKQKLEKSLSRSIILQADHNHLPCKKGAFDSAISVQSFQYNVSEEEMDSSFAEVARVLKPSAVFFLRIRSTEFRGGNHVCESEDGDANARGYSLDYLQNLAKKHGFDIIEEPIDSWDDDENGNTARKGQWNIVMRKREE